MAGNANWIAYSVSTIHESIRCGLSDESAATAISVVETVSATSTARGRPAAGRPAARHVGEGEDPERERPLGRRRSEEDGEPWAGRWLSASITATTNSGASVAAGTMD